MSVRPTVEQLEEALREIVAIPAKDGTNPWRDTARAALRGAEAPSDRKIESFDQAGLVSAARELVADAEIVYVLEDVEVQITRGTWEKFLAALAAVEVER